MSTPEIGTRIRAIAEGPGYPWPSTGIREGAVVEDKPGVANFYDGVDDEFLGMFGEEGSPGFGGVFPYEGTYYRASDEGILWERIEEETK